MSGTPASLYANTISLTVGDGSGGTHSVELAPFGSICFFGGTQPSDYGFQLLLLGYLQITWGEVVARYMSAEQAPQYGTGNGVVRV